MVKCRKATIKANPLPNRFSIKVTEKGTTSSRKLATVSRGFVSRDDGGSVGVGSKRSIFQHLTRLQHGVLRYRNVAESPTSVVMNLSNSSDSDRRFVYVPAGYSLQNDQSLREILMALHLPDLPPLLIVTAATDGAVEESMSIQEEEGRSPVKAATDLDHLTEEEERELLHEKTHEILKGTVQLCEETGAWLMPHRPRRVNGAAEILCSASIRESESTPSTNQKKAVILGLIGLDQQDQKDGFTERITSHMVPVGSEVEAIADVPYDPNVRDNTPCPELTHLLLFQRRQEMRTFRERLLAQTPDVFLAFGNTTPYAKKCLFSTLIAKSPVALVTHTSPEIDHMSWLLRHADRELQKIQVGANTDPPPQGTATYAVSDAPNTYTTLPLAPLPDLEIADPELASFLPMWPAGHDDERIVLADPRRVGGAQFQQLLLRAVNAAFYTRQARTVAIQEASQVLQSIQSTAEDVKQKTELYQMSMVGATLSAVVAAVLYAKIYGADPPPSFENRNPYQIFLFLVTVGAPFVIIYLKKLYDQKSQQWSLIQKEAADLESTIASFRARPSTYGQSTSSSQEPLDAFVSDVCAIRSRALVESQSYDKEEDTVTEESDKMLVDTTTKPASLSGDDYDVEAPPPSESSPLLPPPTNDIPVPSRLEELAIRGSTNKWKKMRMDDPNQDPGIDSDRTQSYLDNLDSYQQKKQEAVSDPATEKEDPSMLWTIADYIEGRIHVVKEQKAAQLAVLEQRHNMMDQIIKAVVGSTALLALVSKQWLIPIILGVSASFVSSQDFRKYQKRVEQGQSMISQLEDLLSWWDGLDVEDKILASNEDRIVQMAESIIAADVSFTY